MKQEKTDYLRVCSWCVKPDKQRAFIGGQWQYMPSDVLAKRRVTHGVCPACVRGIIKGMSEEQQQKYRNMKAMQEPVAS